MFSNGSTTMDGSSGNAGSTGGPLTPATSIKSPNGRGHVAQVPIPTSKTAAPMASNVARSGRLLLPAERFRVPWRPLNNTL